MRFLIDAQSPPALAGMLASCGDDVSEHVTDIGPGDATDRELWAYALENSAVIISKDEGFPGMRLFESHSPGDSAIVTWPDSGGNALTAMRESWRIGVSGNGSPRIGKHDSGDREALREHTPAAVVTAIPSSHQRGGPAR